MEIAWLDSIIHSSVLAADDWCLDQRVGCIIDVVNPTRHQPSVDWFLANRIPVWYKWGSEEDALATRDPEFARLRPRTLDLWDFNRPYPSLSHNHNPKVTGNHLDQSHNDEAQQPSPEPDIPITPQHSPGSQQTTSPKAAPKSRPESEIDRYFRHHEEMHAQMLLRETTRERQAHEARAANPPFNNVCVFEWIQTTGSEYERTATPNRFSADTLDLYGPDQRKFDSFCRTWHCCEAWGNGPEDDDDDTFAEEWLRGTHGAHQIDQASYKPTKVDPQIPTETVDLVLEESTDLPPWIASKDLLCVQVENSLCLHYGFVLPLPDTSTPWVKEKGGISIGLKNSFFNLVGVSEQELIQGDADVLTSIECFGAIKFIEAHSQNADPPPGSWDLRDDVVHPLRLSDRLKNLQVYETLKYNDQQSKQIAVNDGQADTVERYYYFNFGEENMPWRLAVLSPIDALMICRLPRTYRAQDIAFYLSQRGIPFQLFSVQQRLPHIMYKMPTKLDMWTQPFDYKFTSEDYKSYVYFRTSLLGQKHMHAALRHGGFVWRVAMATFGGGDALSMATEWNGVLRVSFDNATWVEDCLTKQELDVLCGAYVCVSGEFFLPRNLNV
ncbi:hypothetical protein FA15DRAFT_708234 [Coprinopsis marcescibilis]|uniref:Uncharacterized protein n=1 Tax=Coprinopsis marcescibilis TaxID=230819 RepID=A0A5C3KWK3_COPMA|nr:hypothetical protein FA15DRAFT_708234 [Coprinopsis marcescibilis]